MPVDGIMSVPIRGKSNQRRVRLVDIRIGHPLVEGWSEKCSVHVINTPDKYIITKRQKIIDADKLTWFVNETKNNSKKQTRKYHCLFKEKPQLSQRIPKISCIENPFGLGVEQEEPENVKVKRFPRKPDKQTLAELLKETKKFPEEQRVGDLDDLIDPLLIENQEPIKKDIIPLNDESSVTTTSIAELTKDNNTEEYISSDDTQGYIYKEHESSSQSFSQSTSSEYFEEQKEDYDNDNLNQSSYSLKNRASTEELNKALKSIELETYQNNRQGKKPNLPKRDFETKKFQKRQTSFRKKHVSKLNLSKFKRNKGEGTNFEKGEFYYTFYLLLELVCSMLIADFQKKVFEMFSRVPQPLRQRAIMER